MQPVTLIASLVALLAISSWCARAARLPEASVWLVVAITGAALLRAFAVEAFSWVDAARPWLLDVLLPLIVFETAYCVDARNRRHLMPAGLLVAGAFVITTWVTASIFDVFVIDRQPVAWIIGVVCALVLLPTDATPVAPHLRLTAPRGLRMLLRNELPFGAALATLGMTVALTYAADGAPRPDWLTLLAGFVPALSIGALVGTTIAFATALPLRLLAGGVLMHWAGIATAVIAFQVAEALGGAGIVAVLATGIVLGREPAASVATDLWRPIGRGITGMLTLALGVAICSLPLDFYAPVFIPAVAGMVLGRTLAVVIVEQATHRWVKLGITMRELALISALGIRGAPTIALALALPDGMAHVDTIRTAAFTVVAFDLLITAPLTPWLAKRFANHAPTPPLVRRPINLPY